MTYHALVSINNATVGGVYYCSNFTTSGAITWTKLTTTGLPSLEITHFRVDYGDPLNKQFVLIGNEIYYRNGGNWTKILDLTIAAAAASASATNASLTWLYTDPTVAGSVYSVLLTDPAPIQDGEVYALKSLDYGVTWTAYLAATSRSRAKCIEAIGNHIWVSAGKLVIASATIHYSPDGGANWNLQQSVAGSSATANLRINPHAPNKVYAWGDGDRNEWTYNAGFTSRALAAFETSGGRADQCWFDPDVADRVIYHPDADIRYSTDNFVNTTTTGSSEVYPAGITGPYNTTSTELVDGAGDLANKTVAYYTAPTDATADERGGANTGTPPYTDAVPNVESLSMYGIWWGTPPSDKGVYVYADEQGDITDMPTYTGLGTPMFGDRGSWRDMYAVGHDIYHAEDVQRATPQIHAPWPAVSGYAPVSDGTKWVATDIVTEAELTAHTGNPSAHHAPVTLDADAAVLLDLSTQEIGLDVQNANTVFAGPSSGAANEPTFRAIVAADLAAGGDATNYLRGDMAWATIDIVGTILDYIHEHAINEDQSLACNGVKINFVTANEFYPETTAVYLNGLRQWIGTDYTEDAGLDAITFTTAPETGDLLIIDYILAGEI